MTERKSKGRTGSPERPEGSREGKVLIRSRSRIFEIFGRRKGEFSKGNLPFGFKSYADGEGEVGAGCDLGSLNV
jgi:hypothetical protein